MTRNSLASPAPAAQSMRAVLYAPNVADRRLCERWAGLLGWTVVAAVRDAAVLADKMRAVHATAVIGPMDTLTFEIRQAIEAAGGSLHAAVGP